MSSEGPSHFVNPMKICILHYIRSDSHRALPHTCNRGVKIMNWRIGILMAALILLGGQSTVEAQGDGQESYHLTLQGAVQLALKHNHTVRIAAFQVEQKQHATEVARSAYFPVLRNESRAFTVTDSQFIQIPAGDLGTAAGTPIPNESVTLNQGGHTFVMSGTTLEQPITQLFSKVKPANDIAASDLNSARANAQETENEIALKVHQIYYKVLIARLHRSATETRLKAAQDLESERVEQVKYGSTLEEQLIESRAQSLEAKQDLLTTELELSDLTMQLNDAIGLPLTTHLSLDPTVVGLRDICSLEDCIKIALRSHPEIVAARAKVEKASAAGRLAKADYVPDISTFARYSYSNNVPFLARNFGTFGVQFTYDLFDGGRRRAEGRESNTQLEQAKENLTRVAEEAELKVQIAYNKLERTMEMVQVSKEVLALREESTRVSAQQMQHGAALKSQADAANAQELDAKTLLLQSQLGYVEAGDELIEAMGQTPK
jgi:outer membrane protein TolC